MDDQHLINGGLSVEEREQLAEPAVIVANSTGWILPTELHANLIAYLRSRPYGEVEDGMRQLLALQPYRP